MDTKYVINQMLKLGMNPRLNGFNYIVDIIEHIHADYPYLEKWKYYYYQVSKKHGVSEACVEKSIRHAFESLRRNLKNYDIIEEYIGYTNCENSSSILKFYNKIIENKNEEIKHSVDFSIIETIIYTKCQIAANDIIADIIKEYY